MCPVIYYVTLEGVAGNVSLNEAHILKPINIYRQTLIRWQIHLYSAFVEDYH